MCVCVGGCVGVCVYKNSCICMFGSNSSMCVNDIVFCTIGELLL